MICSYCKQETKNHKICDFCKADLSTQRPQLNPYLSEIEAHYTQPELMKMHTYDLLRILRHIRAERSKRYKFMQTVRKTPDEAKKGEFEQFKELTIEKYRNLTAQKNVIEEILIDRMGYFPKRVDNKILEALLKRIKEVR